MLLTQLMRLTVLGLLEIPRRLGNSLVIVIGIAGVVIVIIPLLAMYKGYNAALQSDGSPDRAIIISKNASDESESSLTREIAAIIADSPGVKRDAKSDAIASAEALLAIPVARKRDHSDVNVTLRGVGPQYFALRPEIRITNGRAFRGGTQELLVGDAARAQFERLDIGQKIRLQDGDWVIVGTFSGQNGARDSEVIGDAQTIMSAYKLDTFNSVSVRLDSSEAISKLGGALQRDGRVFVRVLSEPVYLAGNADSTNHMLRLAAYSIGTIMSLGALFSALSATYSAVTSRVNEVSTLRAIGFPSIVVGGAILIEAVLLALVGAVGGVVGSYALFSGMAISTVGGALFDSQVVYSLRITPSLIATTIVLACGLGVLGALWPAVRISRERISKGLFES